MESVPRERRHNVPAMVVGLFAVATAACGLFYTGTTVVTALRGEFETVEDQPYFLHALVIMSSVCILCCVIVLVCGVDLVRSRRRWSRLLTFTLIFEVVYFFAIASLWRNPTIGLSVAAATGVANGGLMAQFLILFPLWGPLLLWWAKSRETSAAKEISP